MKKKVISTLLLSVMFLSGCSNGNTDNSTNNANTNNSGSNVTEIVVVDTSVSSSDEALKILKDGNTRFINDVPVLRNIDQSTRDELKDGQSPYAVIVSCSDSRVTPSLVFNAGLGEIFDIRLAGNVVDDDALGSIEYAVEHLHTPLIVVMGHQSCGAVTATYNQVVKGENVTGNIESLVEKIAPAVKKDGSVDDAIHANVDMVVKEISEDEAVKSLIDQGKVKIIGAYYDLGGKVTFNE